MQIQSERGRQYEEEDDILSGKNQGIRIKINKEKKVLNHLSSNHTNTNLLFYNFNSYLEQSDNQEKKEFSMERVPTRGIKSRKEFR